MFMNNSNKSDFFFFPNFQDVNIKTWKASGDWSDYIKRNGESNYNDEQLDVSISLNV